MEKEKDWCNQVSNIIDDKNGESTAKDQHVSWAAYHSTRTEQTLGAYHAPEAFPPSLSDNGHLRASNNSDLLQCLEELVPPNDVNNDA